MMRIILLMVALLLQTTAKSSWNPQTMKSHKIRIHYQPLLNKNKALPLDRI